MIAQAFDVDAVAREIADRWYHNGAHCGIRQDRFGMMMDSITECATYVLRRHVPDAAPRVVEVTADDLRFVLDASYTHGTRQKIAATLNSRLTARAGGALPLVVPERVKVTAEHVRRVRAMLAALGDDVTNTPATDELVAVAYNSLLATPATLDVSP